jgi:hypothetical protein
VFDFVVNKAFCGTVMWMEAKCSGVGVGSLLLFKFICS